MVFGGLFNFSSYKNDNHEQQPTKLPDYFPIQPRHCEKQSQKLFTCIANEATTKARDMELAGLHSSYYDDIGTNVKPGDLDAAKKVKDISVSGGDSGSSDDNAGGVLPKAGDNPLDECKQFIYYYKKCCDKQLKKKHNWILTEPYRVQEEYRYNNNKA